MNEHDNDLLSKNSELLSQVNELNSQLSELLDITYYTVSFNPDNGNESFTQIVEEHKKAFKPVNPTKEGYTFEGWYNQYDELWVFGGYPVTEDFTLTAKWSANEYELILTNNGVSNSYTVYYNDEYKLPSYESTTSLKFVGWYDSNNNQYLDTITIKGNTSLTSRWVTRYYTISFDSNGGSVIDSIEIEYGNQLGKLPIPTYTDHQFNGWYYNGTLVNESDVYNYGENITLTAYWKGVNELFEYEEANNEITITKYIGSDSEVVIPEKISGKEVTTLASTSFANNTLVESIEIPESITNIEDGTLNGCSSISKLTISDTINTTMKKMFGITTTSQLPANFDTIEFSSYSSWPTTFFTGVTRTYNIELPNTLSYLPSFKDNILIKSVLIPDGITSIGENTFSGCSNLTSITIPASVTRIWYCAFYGCSSLTNIDIPKSVSYIGDGAFSGCSNLTSIEIPEGVTSIGNLTFYNCSSLTSIDIPKSVSYIGDGAFTGCSSLTNIIIPEKVINIKSYTFSGCSNLKNITVPEGVTSIGDFAFDGCICLTSVIIPEGIISIGNSAFSSCKSLTDIEIPEGVTTIGESAFRYCSSLTSITIPEGVISIGNSAFSDCSSLTSITIPESVESIGNSVFSRCYNLTIYCEASSKPEDWDSNWNCYCHVIWN